jgi:hypothetical protein
MIYENKDQLKKACEAILACDDGDVRVGCRPVSGEVD